MKNFKMEAAVAAAGVMLSLAIASCASSPYAERKVSSEPAVALQEDLDPVPECPNDQMAGKEGKCTPRRAHDYPLRRGSRR